MSPDQLEPYKAGYPTYLLGIVLVFVAVTLLAVWVLKFKIARATPLAILTLSLLVVLLDVAAAGKLYADLLKLREASSLLTVDLKLKWGQTYLWAAVGFVVHAAVTALAYLRCAVRQTLLNGGPS